MAKAGIVPHLPVQLQRTGQVSLENPKTWQVAIKNQSGEIVGVMSREEAIKQSMAQNKGKIHPDLVEKSCLVYDFSNIDLGKPVMGELNDAERLRLIKQVTGIK